MCRKLKIDKKCHDIFRDGLRKHCNRYSSVETTPPKAPSGINIMIPNTCLS
jgi:hypothetical protein